MGGPKQTIQRLLESEARSLCPSDHALFAVGNAYALRDIDVVLSAHHARIICENPGTPRDQLIHKRLFVFLPSRAISQAAREIGGGHGPPFVLGLCTTHPRWTLPCPDCTASIYDWMGAALDEQIARNKLATAWIRKKAASGSLVHPTER